MRAASIITCDTQEAQSGISFNALGRIEDAAVLCEEGRVVVVGPRKHVEASCGVRDDLHVVDYPDCAIVPGLVDAHTHPLFAGDREPDFAANQRGEKPPLGMLYTVEQTRTALEHPAQFWHAVEARLHAIAAHGTTTLEAKTGYALHKPGEMALLDLLDAHKDEPALPRLVPTFLGAHAIPPEFAGEIDYVDYLIDQCLPFARVHGAVYADAFCEEGFFSPAQTRRYLSAARDHGLRLRVHCDELAPGAATMMAVDLRVDAVDHANYIREQEARAIAENDVVLIACPATIMYLGLPRRAPVRRVLEFGGTVALASDYNPGTSPCFNLQTVAYFGRRIFGLSAAEALYGVTRAAARSLRSPAGVLRAGMPADFVALRIDSPEEFGWQFGGNLADSVYRAGVRIA